jgi:hypothetical protein
MEDDHISATLRGIGLDRTDAHHLMVAVRAECDVFLTLDKRTILNRRTEVEVQFPVRLMDPKSSLGLRAYWLSINWRSAIQISGPRQVEVDNSSLVVGQGLRLPQPGIFRNCGVSRE